MMIAEWTFLFSLPPHDWTSLLQTQVRKSAPSRARCHGDRTLPVRRAPNLLCSRCPVPAAATPPLNPGHLAPFSAKLFHQVESLSFPFNLITSFTLLSFLSVFLLFAFFVLPSFLSFFLRFISFYSADAFGVSATVVAQVRFCALIVCLDVFCCPLIWLYFS